MSVWPVLESSLSGREGALVCVSIAVEALDLETLLEALARLDFPVNPQIYHEAEVVYVYGEAHEEVKPITLVEFPAYLGQVETVEKALEGSGFARSTIQLISMLDQIHQNCTPEPAPAGAPYRSSFRRKSRSRTQSAHTQA
jgi:signal recognition particle subunit SEC65